MAVDFDALDLIRTQNRAEMHERKKIEFLEDRIATLEKTLESHAKILARFQMTEGDINAKQTFLSRTTLPRTNNTR